MRAAHLNRVMVAAAVSLAVPAMAHAQDVAAAPPHDLSVTVYRNPYRGEGGFDLNNLGGFALITETRRVVLTPGEHRLRFEGVADGIEPASAVITGLPSGVVEKNRDAALLSPSALVGAAAGEGGRILFVRTNPETGATTRVPGVIRTGTADDGVVVETTDGIEGLRCSGLPEAFSFQSATTGLSAKPTLSVVTRAQAPVDAVVQLSYLSRGFDWAADYTGDMRAGASKLDLGAWVTLANGNGIGFSNARVQIVAGRLNRSNGEVEPIDIGRPILAQCWPQGSTSDASAPIMIERAYPLGFAPMPPPPPPPPAPMAMAKADRVVVTGSMISANDMVREEQLGDLKLYRVPNRTTVASRQSKQVRLLDQDAVPVSKIYEADFEADENINFEPMTVLLRTQNNKKSNLGLPLPSGRVAVFETTGKGAAAQRLLSAETALRDLAVDEEVELRLSSSPDVQVRQVEERYEVTRSPVLPFLPGQNLRDGARIKQTSRLEITNARAEAVTVEVRLSLPPGARLVKADRPAERKNGRPIFRVNVPANGSLEIRYQTATR